MKLARDDGGHLFSRQADGDSYEEPADLDVDSSNNIFVVGQFREPANLGCGAVSGSIFIAKYTSAGDCMWTKGFADTANPQLQRADSVSISGANVAVTGMFAGSISFGGETFLSSVGMRDSYAARLSGEGGHLQSVRVGGLSGAFSRGVVHSPSGAFYLTGSFTNVAEFGGRTLTAAGSDAFVVGFPADDDAAGFANKLRRSGAEQP